MEEIWKDIKGYEGLYQVSNLGRVRSLDRYVGNYLFKGKIMKENLNSRGYLRLHLSMNNKQKEHKIHKLVAEAFIDNPDKLTEVNHINGIKTDNKVSNLEWCTHKENMLHAFYNLKHQAIVSKNTRRKNSENRQKKVANYAIKIEKIEVYDSIEQAAENNNICRSSIGKCCQGKQKQAGGFVWKWENQKE